MTAGAMAGRITHPGVRQYFYRLTGGLLELFAKDQAFGTMTRYSEHGKAFGVFPRQYHLWYIINKTSIQIIDLINQNKSTENIGLGVQQDSGASVSWYLLVAAPQDSCMSRFQLHRQNHQPRKSSAFLYPILIRLGDLSE